MSKPEWRATYKPSMQEFPDIKWLPPKDAEHAVTADSLRRG
jgi:hypothetical protein